MATDDKTAAKRLFRVVTILLFVAVIAFALNTYREARWYAIHSYVASVCSAVENFQRHNGHFPRSLDEIDKSLLDHGNLDIPLEDLEYEITDIGYRVSYQPNFAEEVSCP
jgi:hypothetical protein